MDDKIPGEARLLSAETNTPPPPEAVESAVEVVLDNGRPVNDSNDPEHVLEDAAYQAYIRLGSYREVANLFRISLATIWRMIGRARRRTQTEVMTIEGANIFGQVIDKYRFVQTEAMGQYVLAPVGSFQRNSFLQTFGQYAQAEERAFRDCGIIPTAPTVFDLRVKRTGDTRVSVLKELEGLTPEAKALARRKLYAALLAIGAGERD